MPEGVVLHDPTPLPPAIFLDRDGTLVRDIRHAADPGRLELLAGVPEALGVLSSAGYRLVVVTNQSGVARGCFSLAEAEAMGEALTASLGALGVELAGYYLCPHYSGPCTCRKPAPGLLINAAESLGLDLTRSWMIGDQPSDVAAGTAAGVRPILVDIGLVSRPPEPPLDAPLAPGTLVARSLPQAVAIILATDGRIESRDPLVRPVPLDRLYRRAPPLDLRQVGEASRWPDAPWAAAALRDAARLQTVWRRRRGGLE